jgi:UDP-GlcNAc:undecaprenyl-phosphate GlcNAc-1-phosphate transferase
LRRLTKLFYLLLAFLSSFLACYFLLKLSTQRALDHTEGVQKFHSWRAVRLGGVALMISLITSGIAFYLSGKDFTKEYILVILSSLPVFLGGLAEDLTKKVGPKSRLFMAFISGILAFLIFWEISFCSTLT